MKKPFHAFCLAACRSEEDGAQTGVGLMRALARRGLKVQGFACGAGGNARSLHAQATGRFSRILNTWLMGHEGVRRQWDSCACDADVAICHGVTALFDGPDLRDPTGSVADCARALDIPVILAFDARGMAASAAALAAGFQLYASRMNIRLAGIIACNVENTAHAAILRRALAEYGLPPLLGVLCGQAAKDSREPKDRLETLAHAVATGIDLDRLLALCATPDRKNVV